jgi:hypothetical protein
LCPARWRLDFVEVPPEREGESAAVARSGIFLFWVLQDTPASPWHWIILRHSTAVALREGFATKRAAFDDIRQYHARREHHRRPSGAAKLEKQRQIDAVRSAEGRRIADQNRRRHLPIARNTIVWLMRRGDCLTIREVADLVGLTASRVNAICQRFESRAVWRAQDRGKSHVPAFLRRLAAAGCFGDARSVAWGRLPPREKAPR